MKYNKALSPSDALMKTLIGVFTKIIAMERTQEDFELVQSNPYCAFAFQHSTGKILEVNTRQRKSSLSVDQGACKRCVRDKDISVTDFLAKFDKTTANKETIKFVQDLMNAYGLPCQKKVIARQ